MNDNRKLVKIANTIQDALMKLQNNRWLEILNSLVGFSGQLKNLASQSKKLGISLTHSWFFAAKRCRTGISRSLDDIQYSMQKAKQFITVQVPELPQLSILIDELQGLELEFGGIDFNQKENTLSVVTEPITLEDVYLGPFRIQLNLSKISELYKNSAYYVIALNPNPAATDETVTHPHVSSERLCEGDGTVTIRTSLEQGRLCDFFTIVKSILNTYSPDSPYIALSEWEGIACYDCGYICNSENRYYCSFCDRDYCEECSSYCHQCDETVCLGCGGQCPQCEEFVCPNCISKCVECEESCCKSCLEDDLCPNCKIEMENENEEQQCNITEKEPAEKQSQLDSGNTEVKLAS